MSEHLTPETDVSHPGAELAPAYALGALDESERAAFEAHLAGCVACAAEVRRFREVGALLAHAAPAGVPSARPRPALRDRIVAQARATPQPAATASAAPAPTSAPTLGVVRGDAPVVAEPAPRPWLRTLPWLAAAASAVLAVQYSGRADRERAARLSIERQLGDARARVSERDSLLAALVAPDMRTARLTATGNGPEVRLFWSRGRRMVMLAANGLPPAAPGRTYQLWGIAPGSAPRSLGTFNSTGEGVARVTMSVPADMAFSVAAVTEEPAGGSPAPTTQPFLTGQVRASD